MANRIGFFPEQNQPSQKQPKKKGKISRFLTPRMVLTAVCAIVFVVCSVLLISYFADSLKTRRATREMAEIMASVTEAPPEETASAQTEVPAAASVTAAPAPTSAPAAAQQTAVPSAEEIWPEEYPGNRALRVSASIYELQQKNSDIVGYLTIDGVLSEPVLQKDNNYYLTHNSLKQSSKTGALFLDETCNLDTVPTQMVIHGHNMKEGSMFGSLKKYKVKDASYYKANPFITFNSKYENGRYVIFAICEVDTEPDAMDYLPFWIYSRFVDVEEFTDYVTRVRDLSHIRSEVDVVPGDRLLTLATCSGSESSKRLLVVARKIRDGENELELNMAVMRTADR